MKKVFNASILAASVAVAFAANAATISSSPVQLSSEGLDVGLTSSANIVFDVVVDELHPAASTITLTLNDVDLATNTVTGGPCTNNPAVGTGTCGDISFDYGTGSFTFDSVVVDDDAGTIKFNVNLGNPLTASSAFRVTIAGSPILEGAATVDYASETSSGTPIETGSGVIAEVVTQYAASVDTELNAVIERANRTTFVRNNEDGATGLVDTLTLAFSDAAATVVNRAFADGTVVTLTGDFSDATVHAAGNWASGVGAATARVNATTITFTYTEAQWDAAATAGKDVITFTSPGGANVLDDTSFSVGIVHDYNSLTAGAGTAGDSTLASAADAGEWELDAALVNVPYLPVGYGYTAQVELSNHSNTDAEVIVEAFDNFGNEYAPVVIGTADAKTVTRFTENQLKEVFGIPAADKVKLNVTFIVNADADKVTLVPYYRQNESRINVLSDQYKADNIR